MKRIIIILVLLNAFTGSVFAHGVHINYSEDFPFITIIASLSGNQPMKNAEVNILHSDGDQIFQSGTTDPSGRFVFIPEKPGVYAVNVDDGMGHRKSIELAVKESFFGAEDSDQETDVSISIESSEIDHHHEHYHIPLLYKVIFGLSLIFGITGIWYGLRKQKD